jgi:hypothetical protein
MAPLSHIAAMTLFAAVASAALAFQSQPTNRERLIYAGKSFVLFVGGAILLAWLLYPISG